MTFSYTPDFTTTRDQMRLEIGDTDSTDPLFSDEELAQFTAVEGMSWLRGCARAFEVLANRAARQPDFEIGGKIKQTSSQVEMMYAKRAKACRARAARTGAGVFSGGHSLAEKRAAEFATDVVQPAFTEEMGTEPATERDMVVDPNPYAPYL